MHTRCDICGRPVTECGRLHKFTLFSKKDVWWLCRECAEKKDNYLRGEFIGRKHSAGKVKA